MENTWIWLTLASDPDEATQDMFVSILCYLVRSQYASNFYWKVPICLVSQLWLYEHNAMQILINMLLVICLKYVSSLCRESKGAVLGAKKTILSIVYNLLLSMHVIS